jgi:predicted nucleic acid-binding protein
LGDGSVPEGAEGWFALQWGGFAARPGGNGTVFHPKKAENPLPSFTVSNTSPINYLVQIGEIEILSHLFERIHVPKAVLDELHHEKAPVRVRNWSNPLPPWVQVHPSVSFIAGERDVGEREAIHLAEKLGIQCILLDDLRGRVTAKASGLTVIGTLGLLVRASQLGLLDLGTAIEQLSTTNFRVDEQLIRSLLPKDG